MDTPVDQLGRKETLEHYTAVQVEDLHAKMGLVIEHVDTVERSLRGEIDLFRHEVNQRLCVVEAAVKEHSRILGEHSRILGEHSGILVRLEQKLDEQNRLLRQMDEKWTARFDDHEARIAAIETAFLQR